MLAGIHWRTYQRMELQQPNPGMGAHLGALEPHREGRHEYRKYGKAHLCSCLSFPFSDGTGLFPLPAAAR